MKIVRLDHLVLTVADVNATIRFYSERLGMGVTTFAGTRTALTFGETKINLHQAGSEFEPKAQCPTPGSADLCLIAGTPVSEVMAELAEAGVVIEEGPVERTGATGTILSCYFRDPDGNLVEVSNYSD